MLGFNFLMAHLLPTSLVDGERSRDDVNNDAADAAVGVGINDDVQSPSVRAKKPLLFHKIQNQKSILALLISDSKIYAGTQSGDLLVCPGCRNPIHTVYAYCFKVWSLGTFELLSNVHAHRGSVLCFFLSADGKLLFSSAGDAIVNVRKPWL